MIQASPTDIIIGVDTHRHTHAAVAITGLGARVAELTIKVGRHGYRQLEAWAASLGTIHAFGIEGTGSSAPVSPAPFATAATPSTRSAVPTAGCGANTARPIMSTRRAPPAPSLAARPLACPRRPPAGSR